MRVSAMVAVFAVLACGDDAAPRLDAGARLDSGEIDAGEGARDAGRGPLFPEGCGAVPISCRGHHESCTRDDECCSGACDGRCAIEASAAPICTDLGNLCSEGSGIAGPCCSAVCETGTCVMNASSLSPGCGDRDLCDRTDFAHGPDCEPCVELACAMDASCCTGWSASCACWVDALCPGRCPRDTGPVTRLDAGL